MSQSATDELKATVNIVEETYEFCLAYAAKGVSGLMARTGDTQVRDQLEKLAQALPNPVSYTHLTLPTILLV